MDAQTSMFPSAYDLKAPAGAEGWEDLYPYYLTFQPNLRCKSRWDQVTAVRVSETPKTWAEYRPAV